MSVDPRGIAQGIASLQQMLGCAWGHIIGAEGYDVSPCPKSATDVVIVHNPHSNPEFPDEVVLKLCDVHREIVLSHTDAHRGS
jgi:hypothetical protein